MLPSFRVQETAWEAGEGRGGGSGVLGKCTLERITVETELFLVYL